MYNNNIPADLKPVIKIFGFCFDNLGFFWHNFKVQKTLSNILIFIFLSTLLVIQVKYMGILPDDWVKAVPPNHLYAIDLAFKLLLIKEIIDMIFYLPKSVTSAQKKQLEVFSLILLRFAFKGIPPLDHNMNWDETIDSISQLLASGFTGLIIFIVVTFYGRMKNSPTLHDNNQCEYFVAEKKTVAFILLVVFAIIIVYDLTISITQHNLYYSVELFFTVFIFADITIVLISLRYSQLYYAVFRNSGFALVAVLIRISITAPPFYREALALLCTLFAITLTFAYYKVTKLNHDLVKPYEEINVKKTVVGKKKQTFKKTKKAGNL
jgi:hypothetical protein